MAGSPKTSSLADISDQAEDCDQISSSDVHHANRIAFHQCSKCQSPLHQQDHAPIILACPHYSCHECQRISTICFDKPAEWKDFLDLSCSACTRMGDHCAVSGSAKADCNFSSWEEENADSTECDSTKAGSDKDFGMWEDCSNDAMESCVSANTDNDFGVWETGDLEILECDAKRTNNDNDFGTWRDYRNKNPKHYRNKKPKHYYSRDYYFGDWKEEEINALRFDCGVWGENSKGNDADFGVWEEKPDVSEGYSDEVIKHHDFSGWEEKTTDALESDSVKEHNDNDCRIWPQAGINTSNTRVENGWGKWGFAGRSKSQSGKYGVANNYFSAWNRGYMNARHYGQNSRNVAFSRDPVYGAVNPYAISMPFSGAPFTWAQSNTLEIMRAISTPSPPHTLAWATSRWAWTFTYTTVWICTNLCPICTSISTAASTDN